MSIGFDKYVNKLSSSVKGDFADSIVENLRNNKDYYSMYNMNNVLRCKKDPIYLGEAIIANENLIWHSVHKYIGKPNVIAEHNCIDKDDILQLGREGFIKAVHAFDTTRGIKFSSFAVTAIVREVRCYIRDKSNIIRLTRTAHSLLVEVKKLIADLGYIPSVEDIALILDEDVEKVRKVVVIGSPIQYLDESIPTEIASCDSSFNYYDIIKSDVDLEDNTISKVYIDSVIDSVRDKLSEIEIEVLYSQLEGHSQTHTAKTFNVSQMKVSRIIKKVAALILKHTDLDVKYNKFNSDK